MKLEPNGKMTARAHVDLAGKRHQRTRMSRALVDGYVNHWQAHGASHALTISLGSHPSRFDPEVEFIPQMRRIVREIAHRLRGVPKRQLLKLKADAAPFMAGFYEAKDAGGTLFPHWHGVIAISPEEEPRLRSLLVECVGKDRSDLHYTPIQTTRPVITSPGAKPTFDLQTLRTPSEWIEYATKYVSIDNLTHWQTHDFLDPH